jgi:prephenate dehydrogenase
VAQNTASFQERQSQTQQQRSLAGGVFRLARRIAQQSTSTNIGARAQLPSTENIYDSEEIDK